MTGSVELTTPLSFLSQSTLTPGKTIQEHFDELALDGKPVVCVLNGTPLLRKDWGQLLTDEDSLQFVAMPQGKNSGLMKILRAVAMLALAIAAPYLAPIIGTALGVTSAIGISLISAGLVLAGSFLINALLPASSASTAQSISSSPTYSISSQGNSARLLDPIPRLYGRHIIYPDFASLPWATYEGNEQFLYQLFCLGVGQYDVEEVRIEDTTLWDNVNGMSDSFSEVQLEIIPPGGSITLFPAAVITATEVGGQSLDDTNWIGPYAANPADRATNRLQVDLIFPRGVYYANDSGGISGYSVAVYIQARSIDALGNPLSGFVNLETYTFSGATATPQRVTRNYDMGLGRYEVRVARTDTKTTDTRYAADVQWAGLRAFIPDDNTFADVTLMAVIMRATNQLTDQSSRKFNVIQTAKLPIWNGTSWSAPTATRSIAWAAADILRNEIYGAGLPDSRIDLTALLALASVWSSRGDRFDAVFDTKQTLWNALSQCLQAGRAKPLLIAGKISFVRDQPATIVRGVLTPRNIIRGTFETTHILYDEDSPDAVIVQFLDERTWKNNEVLCKIAGSTEDNPARVQVFGVIQREQAWREGMYQSAVNLYRRIFGSLSTEMEGRLLIQGDAIAVSHDLARWGQSSEAVAWNESIRRLDISEPVNDDVTVVGLSDRKGRLWGPVEVASITEDGLALILDATNLALIESEQGAIPVYLDSDQEPTRVLCGTLDTYAKRFKLVSGKPDKSGMCQLTLTNDDPRVYTADTGESPDEVSPYGPGTTPDAPKMTGLVVAQSPSSLSNPVTLIASWNAAAGATSYRLAISSDGISWATVYDGSLTSCQFTAEAGPVYIRGAAVGTFMGTWAYPPVNPVTYGTPSLFPAQPQNLTANIDVSAGVLSVSWTPASRASSYRVDVYSIGSGTYNEFEMSRSTSATSLLFTSTDVSAAGGPWDSIKIIVTPINSVGEGSAATTIVSGITMDAPTSISLITPYNGVEINAQWPVVVSASSYVVEIWQAGVMRGQYTVSSTNILITSEALSIAGGPWRSLEIRVKAQNGTLISSAAALTITDSAPSVPSGITHSSPAAGEVTVGWDETTGQSVTAYVLFASDTSGFTPAPANEVYRGLALGVSITGLSSGNNVYFRLRAEDNYAGGDGYNTSSQFSQLVS